jgi:hypothetical protein
MYEGRFSPNRDYYSMLAISRGAALAFIAYLSIHYAGVGSNQCPIDGSEYNYHLSRFS